MCVSEADSCRFPKVGTVRRGARILRRLSRLIECRGFPRPFSLLATQLWIQAPTGRRDDSYRSNYRASLQLKGRPRRLRCPRGRAGWRKFLKRALTLPAVLRLSRRGLLLKRALYCSLQFWVSIDDAPSSMNCVTSTRPAADLRLDFKAILAGHQSFDASTYRLKRFTGTKHRSKLSWRRAPAAGLPLGNWST